jgi:hypothetical protein
MNALRLGVMPIVSLFLIGSGCAPNNSSPAPPPMTKEAKIKASLDKLDPEDRKLAEEQKYCAVETENRLGQMGKPIKVMVKDQPVFLCCKGCAKSAQEDPEKTLAAVKKLKHRETSSREP